MIHKFLNLGIILVVLALGLINFHTQVTTFLGIISFFSVGFACYFRSRSKIFISIIIFSFTAAAIQSSGSLQHTLAYRTEPKHYSKDMAVYLKTYYNMKDGSNYYQAHAKAYLGNIDWNELPRDIWGWRLPTVFYLWTLIPITDGRVIFWLFLLLSLLTLIAINKITEVLLPNNHKYLAILATFLAMPYFYYPLHDWTILQIEWWSVIAWVFGLYFVFHNKRLFATIFFIFSLAFRELMVVPCMVSLIVVFFKKRQLILVFLIPLIIFAMLLVIHYLEVNTIYNLGLSLSSTKPRLEGSIDLARTTLAFASFDYLFYFLKIFSIFIIGSIIAVLTRPNVERLILGSSFILPLFYLKFGTGSGNWVWGTLYVPMVFIGFVLFVSFIFTLLQKLFGHLSNK